MVLECGTEGFVAVAIVIVAIAFAGSVVTIVVVVASTFHKRIAIDLIYP